MWVYLGDVFALTPEKSTKKKRNIDVERILFKKHRLEVADFFMKTL